MARELFTKVKGESRAYKENERKNSQGNIYVYSLVNIEPDYQTGVLKVSKGFTKKGSVPTYKKVDNILITKDDSGTYRFIAISGGKVFDVANWRSGVFSSTLKHSGLNEGFTDIIPVTDRVGGADYIVLLDGGYPHKYDFSTVTDLTTNHKASIGAFTNDRLWTNDVEEKNLAKWCAAGSPTDFTTSDNAGFLPIGHAFEEITAFSSIFVPGINASNIVVAKADKIYGVSGSSGSSTDADRFQSSEINEGIGTPTARGLVRTTNSDLFILGKDDIKPYSTLNNQGIIQPVDISEPIRELYQGRINLNQLSQAFLFYDPRDGKSGRLYCFIPSGSLERNTMAFCYDYGSGGWFRRDFHSFGFSCMCKDPETGKLYAGDYEGNIYEFNEGYNYDGQGYVKFVDFGFVDFGSSGVTKTSTVGSYLDLEIINADSLDMTILNRSGNAILAERITLDVPNYEYGYDEVIYNEITYNQKNDYHKSLDIEGAFEELCLQISSREADVNFKIKRLYLEAEQGAV